jgi:hypothetical protein
MARFYGGRSPYLVKNFRHFRFLAQSFYKGLQGEEAVSKELNRLSSDYTVFRGMNTLYGDVDFIVIGPTGIFVVEAKHWSGKIGLDRHGFLQDGNPTPDALGQIRVASALIQRLLRENREGHVKANPMLVFSEPTAKYMFHFGNVQGVEVLPKHHLSQFIEKHGLVHIDLKAVEKILKEYCYPISHKVMQRILPPQARFVGGHMNLCSYLTGWNIHEA